MILCVLDTHTGCLHLTSAGHPPPLILRGAECVPISDAGGFPIAMMDGSDYEEAVVQLQPGDRLFLFSDGMLEQTQPTGSEQFGEAQLVPLLRRHGRTPPEQLITETVSALTNWAQATSFADDVSVVLVEWKG